MADITKINLKGTELNIRDAGAARSSDLAAKANTTYVDEQLATKQPTLVSGTNIKTINNESLVGSGNLIVQGLKGDKGDKGDTVVLDPEGLEQFEIINDLSTGGASNALSAEMGKTLDESIDDTNSRIDELEGAMAASLQGDLLILTEITAASALISVSGLSRDSLMAKAGGTNTATFTISGRRITSAISIAVSDSTNFALSQSSIAAPQDGKLTVTTITVTYHPAVGATSGASSTCAITVTCDNETYATLNLTGTVAAASALSLTPSTLSLVAESGNTSSGVIRVEGSALEGDVTLTLSDTTYVSFSDSTATGSLTITREEAELGKNVDIYYNGGGTASATITASSTGATSVTASISGAVVARKAAGETITQNNLLYTVLTDTNNVSVQIVSTSLPTGAVVVPASIQDENGLSYNVTEIPANGFKDNKQITSLSLPEGVTTIGFNAIRGLTKMTTLNIPNSVTSLGNNNVYGCTALVNLTIGTGITALPDYFFGSCGDNKNLVLPDHIKSLGAYSCGTTTYNSVVLGTDFRTFYSNIRFKMRSGSTVTIKSTTVPTRYGGYPFGHPDGSTYTAPYTSLATLYVPASAVSTYRAAAGWGTVDGSGYGMFIGENQIQAIPE